MPSLGGATEWLNSEPLGPAVAYSGAGSRMSSAPSGVNSPA
jgi:hypothetical protein